MKKKSKIPEGYSSMKERPGNREKHKTVKVTMVWKQSRLNPKMRHSSQNMV